MRGLAHRRLPNVAERTHPDDLCTRIVMILSWGSTYCLLAVLAGPIRADTGWSAGPITAGVSVGLPVSGLAAPRIGTLIQREGGRRVLASGMA